MRLHNVHIESLAIFEAPEVMSSTQLEADMGDAYARLGIPSRCIEALTGIQERRFWPEGTEIATVAAEAGRRALALAPSLAKDEIGLLISTSVSKEYLEPSVAAMVHGALGLSPVCQNFDISNACLGFLSGIALAGRLIDAGEIGSALLVAGESSRRVVTSTVARVNAPSSTMQDYKDYLPTLTLGSGAVAMVLTHKDRSSTPHRISGVVSRANTSFSRICMGTYDWMRTDATTLLREGVALAREVFDDGQREFGWSDTSISQYICHQVGAAHLSTLADKLALSVDKAFLTYPRFGNMGAVALPFTLGHAVDAGKVKAGDRVSLMGIGSGLNCAMAEVWW
jgi:3-oxoacyl-[acyl-carrier-protein] synthase III